MLSNGAELRTDLLRHEGHHRREERVRVADDSGDDELEREEDSFHEVTCVPTGGFEVRSAVWAGELPVLRGVGEGGGHFVQKNRRLHQEVERNLLDGPVGVKLIQDIC